MTAARAFPTSLGVPRCDGPRSELIAAQAFQALSQELAAWPKPGLVSHVDAGSHHDMDAAMLVRSAEVLRPYFAELAVAGSEGARMSELRAIGLRAETAMLAATGGVNTHRGAIFGLGLLCAAAGAIAVLDDRGAVSSMQRLGNVVSQRWGDEIRRGPVPLHSHGSAVLRRHGAGGARLKAATGFPSIYDVGLPALRRGRRLAPEDAGAAPVQACFALIASVQDTNLFYRGGAEGARYGVLVPGAPKDSMRVGGDLRGIR